jgi:hypothetical protein
VRACASCGRTIGKVAARCLYCGTPATDGGAATAAPAAKASGGARKPMLVTCPGCLRNARVAPGASGSCSYCALAFSVDDDGAPRIGRAATAKSASRADVMRLVADLPSARLWDVVRDVLLRRAAYTELGVGEAERAIDALTLIATWPGQSPFWMPLPLDEATAVVPRVVFGVSDGGKLHEDGEHVLLITLSTRGRLGDAGGRAAVNLLGFASDMAFGVGFKANDPGHVETETRVQIRASLVERHGGIELTRLGNQIDQQPPWQLSVAQTVTLTQRIAASRALLAGYYITGALFGPSCRAGTAFSITRDAIAQRLTALGCDSAPELVDQICVRMPPLFGQ